MSIALNFHSLYTHTHTHTTLLQNATMVNVNLAFKVTGDAAVAHVLNKFKSKWDRENVSYRILNRILCLNRSSGFTV